MKTGSQICCLCDSVGVQFRICKTVVPCAGKAVSVEWGEARCEKHRMSTIQSDREESREITREELEHWEIKKYVHEQ